MAQFRLGQEVNVFLSNKPRKAKVVAAHRMGGPGHGDFDIEYTVEFNDGSCGVFDKYDISIPTAITKAEKV